MSDRTELKTAYKKAIDILARRDHASSEIRSKLLMRGFDSTIVDSVQERLTANDLINDQRFAESFLRMRSGKGFGERDIRAKLLAKGIQVSEVDSVLAKADIDWMSLARQVLQKKMGINCAQNAHSDSSLKRTARFLESRGFTTQQIYRVIGEFSKEHGDVY